MAKTTPDTIKMEEKIFEATVVNIRTQAQISILVAESLGKSKDRIKLQEIKDIAESIKI